MRATCMLLILVLVVLASGCDQKGRFANPFGPRPKATSTLKPVSIPLDASEGTSAASGPRSTPSGGEVILAEDATGVWNQSQVEQYLMEDLKLVSVSIQNAGRANYRGTAVAQDGRNLTLAVQQVPGGIHVDYADDQGGSGSMSFGNPIK